MGFLIRTAITAVAFYIAANLVTGIYFPSLMNLIIAAIIFGVVNAVIRPIVATLSLPLTVLTLGLFTLVVNALMLALTALLMPGMRITSFWAAFVGAVVIWIVSWLANKLVGDRHSAVAR
ncbi:phage holin family protein [Roseomonas harenae]|uniref:phage holin family protein n=1 Tax=Muricoccus harenae TaxID=2692566 RepID=UPI0013317CA0|nr:phage holin family protein [Roseomonas harenae]